MPTPNETAATAYHGAWLDAVEAMLATRGLAQLTAMCWGGCRD
jgi:hypothetical protein